MADITLTAEVELPLSFVNLASDLSQYVACGSTPGSKVDTKTTDGDFRSYANNITRLVTATSGSRILGYTLRCASAADTAKIESWRGLTVLFRDTYGRGVYGSYLITASTDVPFSGKANADLMTDVVITFQQTTYVPGP